jgi:hypothetical protein
MGHRRRTCGTWRMIEGRRRTCSYDRGHRGPCKWAAAYDIATARAALRADVDRRSQWLQEHIEAGCQPCGSQFGSAQPDPVRMCEPGGLVYAVQRDEVNAVDDDDVLGAGGRDDVLDDE